MVGKNIIYDSGGVSLKARDPMHLLLNMDRGGAASVPSAFTALPGCTPPRTLRAS